MSETKKPDIVERLHAWSGACLTPDQVIQCAPSITNILREAAAEIERLRAELQARRAAEAKAVEALREIRTELEQANGGKGPNLPLSQHILQIARAALGARDD